RSPEKTKTLTTKGTTVHEGNHTGISVLALCNSVRSVVTTFELSLHHIECELRKCPHRPVGFASDLRFVEFLRRSSASPFDLSTATIKLFYRARANTRVTSSGCSA